MKSFLLLLLLHFGILFVRTQEIEDILTVVLCIDDCADEQCSTKCKESAKNTTRISFVQDLPDANINLQCRDVNRLVLKHKPGTYIISTRNKFNKTWTFPIINNDTILEFSNLEPKTPYQFRIRKITPQGISLPETTQWFTTNKENYIPNAVKNITIDKIEINKEKPEYMQTYLKIVPADDLNCLYNVLLWGEEHDFYRYQLDAIREYNLKLNHLKYDRNNTVYVISRNEIGSQQSKNVSLTFITPSCLDVHHDLNICAPPPVTGIQIVTFQPNKVSIGFNISWHEPELPPNNYTVVVEPTDCENCSIEVTIAGNQSVVHIPKVALSYQYRISVVAESEGGTSVQWKLFTRAEQSMVGVEVLVAISTLITLAVALTITYTYCRYKHVKSQACRYSFFENINKKNYALEDLKSPLKSSTYDSDENKPRDKFEIQIDRLSIKKVLGTGFSGIVKLATLQDDQKKTINVAVKMLREDASSEDIRNFHREISLMKSTGNHRNIVSIIGCCTLDKNPLLIVEYCSKGDLQTYLRTILEERMTTIFKNIKWSTTTDISSVCKVQQDINKNFICAVNNRSYDIQQENVTEDSLKPEDLLNFARQVATGMEFLSSNRIVHRDLAARNVLVCSDRTVKISDFGLSRDIYQENVYKKQSDRKLPLKWMAIEALTHQVYTTHSDVWSFGVLLYEIVTLGGNPYPGFQSNQILQILKTGYRMERPPNCGYQLYEIMRSCWHENPSNRPTFSQLKQQLDTLLSTITKNEYLNLIHLLQEPTQRFTNHETNSQNILTIPHIT